MINNGCKIMHYSCTWGFHHLAVRSTLPCNIFHKRHMCMKADETGAMREYDLYRRVISSCETIYEHETLLEGCVKETLSHVNGKKKQVLRDGLFYLLSMLPVSLFSAVAGRDEERGLEEMNIVMGGIPRKFSNW